MKTRKGLGVAPFCLPEPVLADSVTHQEFQTELNRLRAAIRLVANRIGYDLDPITARRLIELLLPPEDRPEPAVKDYRLARAGE